jgi:hypothetical protein
MIRRVEAGISIALFNLERKEEMRTRAPKKYESLLFFNLGFCSVLLLVGLGACRPQIIRNADQSFTVVNLDSASGRQSYSNKFKQSEGALDSASLASVPMPTSRVELMAYQFAMAQMTDLEAGLGSSDGEARQFAARFGARQDGEQAIRNYATAYRFFLRTRESMSAPNVKSEAMAFAERVHALADVSDVLKRYEAIYSMATEKGISSGRAFNLADRFQPLENAIQVAEKFVAIFAHARNGHLDEDTAIRLAEKYSGTVNGETLIEQWLAHFNSQQGRMAREQAILYADQQIAGQVQKSESSPEQQPQEQQVAPVQQQATFTAENVPQEYVPEQSPVNPADLPPVEAAPPQQPELHGATF